MKNKMNQEYKIMIELLQKYIKSWLEQDKKMFTETLAEKIDIRECYGASYATKAEAENWFTEWNKSGCVLNWEIKDTFFDPERKRLIATWEFYHICPDPLPDRFDGITVMAAENGKIILLHEYETKHNRFYPYKVN